MQILKEADTLRRRKEKEKEKRPNKTQLVSHAFVLERLPTCAHAPACDFERRPLCLHPAQRNVQFSTVGVWKLSEKDVTLMI